MENVNFREVDSTEEICKVFNRVIDNQNQIEGKLLQLIANSQPKKAAKPKKKGFTMIKTMLAVAIMTIMLFVGTANAYVASDINDDIASNHVLLAQYLRDTVNSETFTFTPIAAPTNNDIIEGKMYYDISSKAWFGSTNGTTWTQFEAGGSTTSLDGAYNNGITISVDAGAVVMTASNAADNVVLTIVQSDTGTTKGLTLTNAGTGNTIDIQGQSSSNDIEGTSDSWAITSAGAFSGESLTGVTHSQGINFDTNNEIQFGDNSEDVAMVFTGNTLSWATDSGVDQMAFGVVDDLTGIASLAGDTGADFAISVANSATFNLTVSQTGVGDNQVIIQSAGSAANAVELISSIAGTTITSATVITGTTAAGAITFTATGGDVVLDSTDASIVIRGTQEAADAIAIDADGTAGGITVDYGTGNMVITGTGASADFSIDADLISIDGTGVSNITVTGGANEDFTIAVAGVADLSLILSSTGTGADALQITTSAGGIQVTNGGASGEDLLFDGVLSAVGINSDEATTDAIDISATLGGITMTSTAVASAWTHTATGAADDLTISVAGTNDSSLILTSAGTGEDALSLLATGTSASAASILIDTADGGIVMTADGGTKGDITIDAESDVSIVAVGTITYTGVFHAGTIIAETISANDTMDTAADVGTLIQVDTAGVVILLPAVATGLEYWVMNTGADGTEIHVDTNASDKILGGCGFTALDDGDRITNTGGTANKGDYVRLRYGTAVGWYIVEMNGIWADGG